MSSASFLTPEVQLQQPMYLVPDDWRKPTKILKSQMAKEQFHIGRLFGLRCNIVHRGFLSAIDGRLLRYCEGLYGDLLWQKMGLPSERRLSGAKSAFVGPK